MKDTQPATQHDVRVSCVIPAYNEEKSIKNALDAVRGVARIAEIIVVDDGSTDKTQAVVRSFAGVTLLVNEKNLGKAGAVARGIEAASGDLILLLDADLIGLKTEHVASLLGPIEEGRADVVISMRENTPGWMKSIELDFMSGERVYQRAFLMRHLDAFKALHGFGIEVFSNRMILREQLRVATVMMPGVRNDFKWKKRGFWFGAWKELLLWKDLFMTISPIEFVSQNVRMRKLLVNHR